MQKIRGLLIGCALISALVIGNSQLLAQDVPSADQQGPSAEEIQQFRQQYESQQGGPTEQPVIEQPQPEVPGKIPDEIKQYASEADLVSVYCATTKWMSGDFFSAMKAIKENLLPAMEKVKELGVTFTTPNIDQIILDANTKIEGICSASTTDDADAKVKEFITWSGGLNPQFDALKNASQNEVNKLGDKLRAEVNAAVDEILNVEKPKMTKEIEVRAKEIVDAKNAQLQGSTTPPNVEAIKAEIMAQLQPFIDQKKAALEAMIKIKVDELVLPQKAKFEAVGAAFTGMTDKINNAIKAGRSNYDQYKTQSIELRKKLILQILDKNMEAGLKQLDENSADVEEARKSDPTIPSIAEIKSGLEADRALLIQKIDVALEANDDNAVSVALADFKSKWEKVRTDMEKTVAQSSAKICGLATTQFADGKKKMQDGLLQIKTLLQQCSSESSDRCLKVNEFADRLNTLRQKSTDVLSEMAGVETMCANPTIDIKSLAALLKKLQADGDDLKTYGTALEADKNKVLADSAQKICAQVLPQVEAGVRELQNESLSTLKSNLSRCNGKSTEDCKIVNQFSADYNSLVKKSDSFTSQVKALQTICAAKSFTEGDMDKIATHAGNLKTLGADLKNEANALKAKQSEKGSEKVFCKAVTATFASARQEISTQNAKAAAVQKECAGKTDQKCLVINGLKPKFDALNQRVADVLKKINTLDQSCLNPSTNPPNQTLVDIANTLEKDHADILAMAKDLQAEQDKAKIGNGPMIQAEDATKSGKGNGPNNFAREVNPSWRPPYFGTGSWYLGNGGDYLEYSVEVPSDGKYHFWIRDLASSITDQQGVRIVNISMDGKVFATTAENMPGRKVSYPKGAYFWHEAGTVQLKAGKHTLRVTKASTTSGAAEIDAYYLTTGTETPAEK